MISTRCPVWGYIRGSHWRPKGPRFRIKPVRELVEEPFIVGFDKQFQDLAHRQMQVGPLRLPGTVNARRALVHTNQEEQDHCRKAEAHVDEEGVRSLITSRGRGFRYRIKCV